MSKKKAGRSSSWEDMIRDESITEEDMLRQIRMGIIDALARKNADAVKTLAEAHSEIKAVRERRVGY